MAMERTTVYLPRELQQALKTAARARGVSEAAMIREGIAMVTREASSPRPRLPLFASGDPTLAERVDEELAGFGDR